MSTAAVLLAKLRGDLKTREDHQRKARNQCRLAIGGAGLVNGTFPVAEAIRDNLEKTLEDPKDRKVFESEVLELDGWTYVRQRHWWLGPSDGQSGSPASDDSQADLLVPEDFEPWVTFYAQMADPHGWQIRQARRAWLLVPRAESALRSRDVLDDLRKLADEQTLFVIDGLPDGEKDRSLFEKPLLRRDKWLTD